MFNFHGQNESKQCNTYNCRVYVVMILDLLIFSGLNLFIVFHDTFQIMLEREGGDTI